MEVRDATAAVLEAKLRQAQIRLEQLSKDSLGDKETVREERDWGGGMGPVLEGTGRGGGVLEGE